MLFISVSKGIRVHIIYHSQVCHVQHFYTKLSFQYSSNKVILCMFLKHEYEVEYILLEPFFILSLQIVGNSNFLPVIIQSISALIKVF